MYSEMALFLHAFTGCDTTSGFFKKGKVTSWNALYSAPSIAQIANVFKSPHSTRVDIVAAGEMAMKILYGVDSNTSLSALRYRRFCEMGGKRKVDLRGLPPTEAATEQHSYRVYAQIQLWLNHRVEPTEWGWMESKCGLENAHTRTGIE